MEEFKGTPGPWEWWTSNSFLRLSSRSTGKDGDVIDSFMMSDGHTSLSVKHEDMALISAAPEMFAALRSLYLAVLTQPSGGTLMSIALERTRDTLHKALGK